jgi:tetratricopeptide (TPR) repeat protein
MCARRAAIAGFLVCMLAGSARAQDVARADPLTSLDRTLAAAEASLRAGELQIAESHYRSAIADGWLILGSLAAADGRVRDARDQFKRASTLTLDASPALQALAIAHLQLSEADAALDVLNSIPRSNPPASGVRRLIAQALVAAGRPAEAVQELEEAHTATPGDLELTFLLASGYLRLNKMEAAERLFAKLVSARPIAETHVLIGRTYRDAAEYARARRELQAALQLDARVRRAHYYLGTIDIMSEGISRLEPAIAAFKAELALSPGDPPTSLGLGLALVHARRHAEALPHLERAVTSPPLQGNGYYYLGRCLLGLNRPADAVTALQKSLELSNAASGAVERKNIHYQLGLALRGVGKVDEAATHFAQAEQAWDGRLAGDRERLSRYLADTPEPQGGNVAANMADALPFSGVAAATRAEIAARVRRSLAGAYMNVGIMHAQAARFSRASEFLEDAAALAPTLDRVQYSLGVAHFNAKEYD